MITLIHPSRQRPEQAFAAFNNWIDNMSFYCNNSGNKSTPIKTDWLEDVQYLISLDEDDPTLEEYRRLFYGPGFIVGQNNNVVQAINNAAKHAEGDVIVVMSDDFKPFLGWDLEVEKLIAHHGKDKLFKTKDGTQPWIVTLPIMGIDLYKDWGYVYHPDYKHMFVDTDMTHLADITGKLVFAMDLPFIHEHYTTGAREKDAVNEKADSTWNQGETTYLNRVKNNFGLENVDVFNISPAGRTHLSWLNSKLNR